MLCPGLLRAEWLRGRGKWRGSGALLEGAGGDLEEDVVVKLAEVLLVELADLRRSRDGLEKCGRMPMVANAHARLHSSCGLNLRICACASAATASKSRGAGMPNVANAHPRLLSPCGLNWTKRRSPPPKIP